MIPTDSEVFYSFNVILLSLSHRFYTCFKMAFQLLTTQTTPPSIENSCQEHMQRLRALMEFLRLPMITVNSKKCEINQIELNYTIWALDTF